MCGIAGTIGFADAAALARMANALAPRGPDAEGMQIWEHIPLGFAHRRLAIIDLSPAGRQPMLDEKKRLAIIFNGEIYNYRELRTQLEAAGQRFLTESDTEVLLGAYAQWGSDCLPKLRGMFAFAIADLQTGEVFIARDRFGIKPLLYAPVSGGLLLASELKALLASGLLERKVNRQAVWDYVSLGSVAQPDTILEGVHCLPPGHFLHVAPSGEIREQRQWWRLAEASANLRRENAQLDFATAARELRARLEDATRAHLIADVPVGAFLSGGIDSAAMVALMSRLLAEPVRTFTVGFETKHADFSETDAARQTARHFGSKHHEVIVPDSEIADNFDAILNALDQPSMDGANTWFVARATTGQVKVALSGLGGDELFAGYPHFSRHARAAQLANPLLSPLRWLPSRFRHNLCLPALSPAERLATLRCQFYEKEKKHILNPEFFSGFAPLPLTRLPEQSLTPGLDTIDQLSLYELEGYLPRTLLRDGDVASMAHGLEARPILLDHELAEFAFSLSSAHKLRDGRGKAVFLAALADLLPPEIVQRKKRGFELPLLRWLSGSLAERAHTAFSSTVATELFEQRFLADCRQRLQSPTPRDFYLWPLFILLEWLRGNH